MKPTTRSSGQPKSQLTRANPASFSRVRWFGSKRRRCFHCHHSVIVMMFVICENCVRSQLNCILILVCRVGCASSRSSIHSAVTQSSEIHVIGHLMHSGRLRTTTSSWTSLQVNLSKTEAKIGVNIHNCYYTWTVSTRHCHQGYSNQFSHISPPGSWDHLLQWYLVPGWWKYGWSVGVQALCGAFGRQDGKISAIWGWIESDGKQHDGSVCTHGSHHFSAPMFPKAVTCHFCTTSLIMTSLGHVIMWRKTWGMNKYESCEHRGHDQSCKNKSSKSSKKVSQVQNCYQMIKMMTEPCPLAHTTQRAWCLHQSWDPMETPMVNSFEPQPLGWTFCSNFHPFLGHLAVPTLYRRFSKVNSSFSLSEPS